MCIAAAFETCIDTPLKYESKLSVPNIANRTSSYVHFSSIAHQAATLSGLPRPRCLDFLFISVYFLPS